MKVTKDFLLMRLKHYDWWFGSDDVNINTADSIPAPPLKKMEAESSRK